MIIVLKTSIVALLLAIGMTATPADVVYLWRRPLLLGKAVLAMYVVMPLVAVAMARLLELPRGTELALVILAVCAGAPLLPKKLIKAGGNPAFVFSLIVTTSLAAIVTVPVSLHFLVSDAAFDTAGVTPTRVAWLILTSLVAPMGAGMLLRWAAPAVAERIGAPLLRIAGIVMSVCALIALVAGFHLVFDGRTAVDRCIRGVHARGDRRRARARRTRAVRPHVARGGVRVAPHRPRTADRRERAPRADPGARGRLPARLGAGLDSLHLAAHARRRDRRGRGRRDDRGRRSGDAGPGRLRRSLRDDSRRRRPPTGSRTSSSSSPTTSATPTSGIAAARCGRRTSMRSRRVASGWKRSTASRCARPPGRRS